MPFVIWKETFWAILNLFCLVSLIKFLLMRIYGLEEDVGWRIPRWLFNAAPIWHLYGMISAFLCNLSACCLPPSFCSRAYMVWKRMMFGEIPGWLFSARQSLVCKWDNWNYFWVSMLHETFHQVGWIIPGWLFSTRQSLICKLDDLSYFWVSMLQEAFHQVSDQEDIWFWRWWWLKNSKMAV